MKYTLTVEAEQWFPEKRVDGIKYYNRSLMTVYIQQAGTEESIEILPLHATVESIWGLQVVSPGDWIVSAIKGEIFACSNEEFEKNYTAIKD